MHRWILDRPFHFKLFSRLGLGLDLVFGWLAYISCLFTFYFVYTLSLNATLFCTVCPQEINADYPNKRWIPEVYRKRRRSASATAVERRRDEQNLHHPHARRLATAVDVGPRPWRPFGRKIATVDAPGRAKINESAFENSKRAAGRDVCTAAAVAVCF